MHFGRENAKGADLMGQIAGKLRRALDIHRPNRYRLKAYRIHDGKTHPFALICPGGCYRKVCSYVEGAPYAKALNALGYHAFVVYYRVREKARYPAPQEDVARAAREIFSHAEQWKVDPEGWSLWGSSAGGHLAASYCALMQDAPMPAVLVLCYPVVTMGEKTHAESKAHLLGPDPDSELVRKLSVETQIRPGFPPTFLWWGTDDRSVDPCNSRMLAEALQAQGIDCQREELEGVGHGAGLGNGLPWFRDAVSFWEAHRKGKGSP